jgi:hypothetical protein
MNEDRWEDVKRFIGEWHRPLQEGDGYSEEEVQEAEARLGVRFPEALRELYMLLGKRKDMTNSYNCLTKLEDLELIQGHLPFWNSHQDVTSWLITSENFGQANLAVHSASIDYREHFIEIWETATDTLTNEVLLIIAINVAETSSEPHNDLLHSLYIWEYPDDEASKKLKSLLETTHYLVLDEERFRCYDDILIQDSGMLISIASKNEQSILDFIEKFALEGCWKY